MQEAREDLGFLEKDYLNVLLPGHVSDEDDEDDDEEDQYQPEKASDQLIIML